MNRVYILTTCFFKIHFNINSHLHLGLTTELFSSGIPTKILYTFLFSHAFYVTHHSPPPPLMNVIVFYVENRLWSSHLNPPDTSKYWPQLRVIKPVFLP
jgi:hypothetical protein